MSERRYMPDAVPHSREPRVFLAFEDRQRDLTGLLEFGTVIQIFPSYQRSQLTNATAEEFLETVRLFFEANGFSNDDSIAAVGDPVVIASITAVAARQNRGRVRLLKWDRLRCPACHSYRVANSLCDKHVVTGRYIPITLNLPSSPN